MEVLVTTRNREEIEERTLEVAEYIIEKGATVREAAAQFGISKSTVFLDVTMRLPGLNKKLAEQISHQLLYHKQIRHLRGGQATKEKYQAPQEA